MPFDEDDFKKWFDGCRIIWGGGPPIGDQRGERNSEGLNAQLKPFRKAINDSGQYRELMRRFADTITQADLLQKRGVHPEQIDLILPIAGVAAQCGTASQIEVLTGFLDSWFQARPGGDPEAMGWADSKDRVIESTPENKRRLHGRFLRALEDTEVRRQLQEAFWKVAKQLCDERQGSANAAPSAEPVAAETKYRIANRSAGSERDPTDRAAQRVNPIDRNPSPSVKALELPKGVASGAAPVAASAPTPAPPPPITAQWTWLPPDPAIPSRRQGQWTDSIDGFGRGEALEEALRFVAAAARGRGHKQDALFCDDSFEYVTAGTWRVVIASDGAGSAKFSRVGSELASSSLKRTLERKLAEIDIGSLNESDLQQLQENPAGDNRTRGIIEALESGFADAMTAITQWVEQKNSLDDGPSDERKYIDQVMRGTGKESSRVDPENPEEPLRISESDCNCTLLVAAGTKVKLSKSDGTVRDMAMVISCAVGDGMIAVFRRIPAGAPHAILLMAPDTGQYAGQTQFLSRSTAQPESVRGRVAIRFAGAYADIVAIAAMTDGVADDYYDGEAGMERLYCDLIMNGILHVSAIDEVVAKERGWAERVLLDRAESAATEIAHLVKQRELSAIPADHFRLDQERKALERRASWSTLSSLVVQESVFSSPAEGKPQLKGPLKYASIYMDALGLTARELLTRPGLLRAIAEVEPSTLAIKPSTEHPSQSAEEVAARLFTWLDTYIVKGSFDDRSLVLFETGVSA